MTILPKNKFRKEILFIAFAFFLFFIVSPILFRESSPKTVVILLSLLSWVGLFIYTKNIFFSSILYIFLVLPFNVTLQVPLSVEIFNTEILIANPFVEGIYANYLVPTLSILDLGIVLVLGSILITRGFRFYVDILRNFKNGMLFLLIFLILQNIILLNFNSLLFSIRLFCLIVLFISLLKIVSGEKLEKRAKEKILNSGIAILLINILIQGALGVSQFKQGSSIGLSFLGESEIVSGMMGSSFVELSGKVFLRAYGTFPHPNVLGGFLILGMFLGIYIYRKRKGAGISLMIISLFPIILTFSRISILLAVVILLGFVAKEFVLKRRKVLLSTSFYPLLLMERFMNLFNSGDRSWSERLDLIKASFKVIKQNWLIGIGGGNFVNGMEGFVPRTSRGILLTQPVHNIFLLYLSEFGILGFLLIFYVLFYTIINDMRKISFYGGLILLTIVVIGLFDHYLFSLSQGMVIFFSLLFLASTSLQEKIKV